MLIAVKSLSARWRVFCTILHLRSENLNVIERNNPGDAETCLCSALEDWLKMNYDYKKHGTPSWRKLAEAAKSLDEAVFKRIADGHPHKGELSMY